MSTSTSTLKITYICASSTETDINANGLTFTQEIGDIPSEAFGQIKTRINNINTALNSIGFTAETIKNNWNTYSNQEKYAAALRWTFSVKFYPTPTANPTQYFLHKITAAEAVTTETTNIYNYANVGA